MSDVPNSTKKSMRQVVSLVGTLESVEPEARRFVLRLDNEQEIPGALLEGDINALGQMIGKRVLMNGMGVWKPNGKFVRMDVDRFFPGEGESDIWGWLPQPRGFSPLPPEEPTPRPWGLVNIIGKWPGDETDEQIAEALKRIS